MAADAADTCSTSDKPDWDFTETIRHLTSSSPNWLAEYLGAQGRFIRDAFYARKIQLGRSKLLYELRALERAARFVQSYVDRDSPSRRGDSGVRVLLSDQFGWHNSNSFRQMREPLGALIASVQAAQKSPELVEPEGETIRGRGKPDLLAGIPAEELCALIVSVLMEHFDGSQPSYSHRRAWEAAEAYWRAIGLKRKSRGLDAERAWRAVFERINTEDFRSKRNVYSENLQRWTGDGREGAGSG
jgi:hypothetical protein